MKIFSYTISSLTFFVVQVHSFSVNNDFSKISFPLYVGEVMPDESTDGNKKEKSWMEESPLIKLNGVVVTSVANRERIDLSTFLSSNSLENNINSMSSKTMLIFGTYAADFNAIEYAQRLRYYLPKLKDNGITRIGLILNCEAEAAMKLMEAVDLQTDSNLNSDLDDDDSVVKLFVDPLGNAGRAFGVGRGWKVDDNTISPFLKLFGMLFGLGAWATLPAVIGGYIGNPFYPQPWIEDALAIGQKKGRFPSNALELDKDSGEVIVNKFRELPIVGGWERRPLELATLRLQNMIDISIKNWNELVPTKDALDAGVLTQLGGCLVTDTKGTNTLFKWRDPGICAVTNFEDVLEAISEK